VGNLLDNAYNASLRQPQGSKQIECLINSDGQEVIIEIADQGCGIDETLRDRIFERGVTSSASKDHGIGLWLVRSYVEQAGGSIVVENNIPLAPFLRFISP
jgi:two-component system cit operon sensor histidine kinase CitA